MTEEKLRKKDYPAHWQKQFEQQRDDISELECVVLEQEGFIDKIRDTKNLIVFWFRLTIGLAGSLMVFCGFLYQPIARVLNNYTPLSLGYQAGFGGLQRIVCVVGGLLVLGILLTRWGSDE